MGLIGCPECEKQISEHAVACPNCGYPIANPPNLTPSVMEKSRKLPTLPVTPEKNIGSSLRGAAKELVALVAIILAVQFTIYVLDAVAPDSDVARAGIRGAQTMGGFILIIAFMRSCAFVFKLFTNSGEKHRTDSAIGGVVAAPDKEIPDWHIGNCASQKFIRTEIIDLSSAMAALYNTIHLLRSTGFRHCYDSSEAACIQHDLLNARHNQYQLYAIDIYQVILYCLRSRLILGLDLKLSDSCKRWQKSN